MTALALKTWPGSDVQEARATFERSRSLGMSFGRSFVVGCLASYPTNDAWVFRRTLAEFTHLSIRTVQRALTQARSLGIIGTARAKPNEIPKGAKAAISCGWSHRWIVGRGMLKDFAMAAINRARLARLFKAVHKARKEDQPAPKPPPEPKQRHFTKEELDEQLEQLATRHLKPDRQDE